MTKGHKKRSLEGLRNPELNSGQKKKVSPAFSPLKGTKNCRYRQVSSQNNAFFMYFLLEQGKVEGKRTNG